jgi:multimeric flavodoxin WrbA
MEVLAINGSPRKQWNTATLLNKALEGAKSQGADTELIHLYELDFKGCTSCFACKKKDGESYGKCAYTDELTPLLERIEKVDALILGSPIYLGSVTGMMRCCMERLIYPYLASDDKFNRLTLFKNKISTGLIYTMNANENQAKLLSYNETLGFIEMYMKQVFGAAESLLVYDTLQFKDYSKYIEKRFNPEAKTLRRKEVFPIDCEKAFELGVSLIK